MLRREFLRSTTLLSTSAVCFGSLGFNLHPKKQLTNIGLQLWTVRTEMGDNPVGTIKKIQEAGYSHVENAGYQDRKFYGQTKENFKLLLQGHELQMHSGHVSTGFGQGKESFNMANNWEKVCEDAAYMGQKYIVCGYFQEGERKTIDDYKKLAALFNICGNKAKEFGLQFCHHNHDFEFIPINGIVPYDILLKETDKNLVKFELDHYWTKKANVNTKKLIKRNAGRFPLFHIKDMDNTPQQSFTEVGTGIIDWNNVFKLAPSAGLDLFFIEQDICTKMSPLESIKISIDNIKKFRV